MTGLALGATLNGQYCTSLSPCGSNCSYEIKIPGPTFQCVAHTYSNLPTLITTMYGNTSSNGLANSQFSPSNVNYIAAQNGTTAAGYGKDVVEGTFIFEMQWVKGANLSALSCTTWYSHTHCLPHTRMVFKRLKWM